MIGSCYIPGYVVLIHKHSRIILNEIFYNVYCQQLTHTTENKNEYNNNNNTPGIETGSLGTVNFDVHKVFTFSFLCVL